MRTTCRLGMDSLNVQLKASDPTPAIPQLFPVAMDVASRRRVAGIYRFIHATSVHGRRPRLLVVDDEEGPRQSVRIVFKDLFDVLMVDTSELALIACAERCFDVVVSDNRRAGMNGLDCFAEMRQLDPEISLVFLSAYFPLDRMERAIELGAYGVVEKPFLIEELYRAVMSALLYRLRGGPLPPVELRPFPRWWREWSKKVETA